MVQGCNQRFVAAVAGVLGNVTTIGRGTIIMVVVV